MSRQLTNDGRCPTCGAVRDPATDDEEVEPHLDWCDWDGEEAGDDWEYDE